MCHWVEISSSGKLTVYTIRTKKYFPILGNLVCTMPGVCICWQHFSADKTSHLYVPCSSMKTKQVEIEGQTLMD